MHHEASYNTPWAFDRLVLARFDVDFGHHEWHFCIKSKQTAVKCLKARNKARPSPPETMRAPAGTRLDVTNVSETNRFSL